eukprot:scaffold18171_cov42-Cyclotella_meneghiniana.AAC.3
MSIAILGMLLGGGLSVLGGGNWNFAVVLGLPCREMPMSKWMVRPATNGELSLVYNIWRRCWPLLREPSRRSPPNSWQILVYQRALNRKMGPHRDNFERKSLKNLEQGGCPYNPEAHPHMKNSQTYG